MNLPPSWVEFFLSEGFEAKHWSTLGAANAKDETLFACAKENNHTIFTHDLDFSTLPRETHSNGPSVMQVRGNDTTPQAIGATGYKRLAKHEETILKGALLTIEPSKARIRLLPIMELNSSNSQF